MVRGAALPTFIEAEILTPLAASAAPAPRNPGRSVVTLAELADGATVAQAQAETAAIVRQLTREFPATHVGWTGGVEPVRQWQYGAVRTPILLLSGAAMFVLILLSSPVAGTGRGPPVKSVAAPGAVRPVPEKSRSKSRQWGSTFLTCYAP